MTCDSWNLFGILLNELTRRVAAKYDRAMGDLPDQFVRRLLDDLCHARPPDAEFYALVGCVNVRRYPEKGSFRLYPSSGFEPPYGVPSGEYLVSFYRQQLDNTMLPYLKTHSSFRLSLRWPGEGNHQAQLRPEAALAVTPAVTLDPDPELRAVQIEFEKHKMAVAMQRDTHRLVRSAAHARDAGESYSVVAAYRQDSYLSAESYSALNRRMTESLSKIQETHIALVQSIEPTITAIKKASELLAVPPAPVDYTPVLAELVQVGGSMITRLLDHDRRRRPKGEPRELGEARAVASATGQGKATMPEDQSSAPPPRSPDPAPTPTVPNPVSAQLPTEQPARAVPASAPPPASGPLPASAPPPAPVPPPVALPSPATSSPSVDPELAEQERLVNELADPSLGASVQLPVAVPPQKRPVIDRLTDPQRPELAVATQEFLRQFDSAEELQEHLRLIMTAFDPRLVNANSGVPK